MKKHYTLLFTFLIAALTYGQAQVQCTADYYFTSSPGTLTVNFFDSSSYSPGFIPLHSWWFSDGNTTSGLTNPTHTFSAPGTYIVYMSIFDSLNTCFDSTSRYVSVPLQRAGNCTASFTVAKDTSTAFGVTLTNTSSVSNSQAFTWDFGDGNSGSGATPMHTYQNFGSYNVCLTVFDSLSNCVNTFCDTVGLDSNGNLKANGFSLTVVLPNVTSIDELTLEQALNVYPNPATDQLILDLSQIDRAVSIRLFNLNGQEVTEMNRINNQSTIVLDVSDYSKGLYILQIEDGVNSLNRKIVIR